LVPGPWPLEGGDLASEIWKTGRPVRIDDYHGVPGRIAAFVRDELGIRASAGSPIVVERRLWGALFIHSKQTHQPLPRDTEARLTGFTELVATAVANIEARAEVERLVEEQAALRRVATLVARGIPPEELFTAVAEEVGRLFANEATAVLRYHSDGSMVVGSWSRTGDGLAIAGGSRAPFGGQNVSTLVFDTGRPARVDRYPADDSSAVTSNARRYALASTVGAPISVEGRLWGALVVGSSREAGLPAGVEERLEKFAELLATAMANADSRSQLAASRSRIAAAADETRRRIERDLHDGIQQRLVSLGLEVRTAQAAVPAQLGEVQGALSRVAGELASVFDELREISRGIHPAILSEGGLEPALRALRRRSAVPVELDLHVEGRLPEPVEVAAYYVVSEALTNAAKHAHASVVNVELDAHGTVLRLVIRDDGMGGAGAGRGSGLVGLRDRIEALGGTLEVSSPAGKGTTLLIEVPLDNRASA
jgi:signal transduction histidine kinase